MVDIFSLYTNMIAAFVSPSKAEKIAEDVLSLNDKMLSVSIRDWSGNSLAVKSTEAFRQRFRANRLVESKYSGALAVAALGVVNEVKDVFGEAQAIITLHKDCKLMLLPMLSYRVLIGLVFERLAVVEDYSLANKIERILVETVESQL
jgi:hypothetical protein